MFTRLAAISIAIVLASASPAFAHDTLLKHGKDVAEVHTNHQWVTIDDNECDSHTVYIRYRSGVNNKLHVMADTDGCGGKKNYDYVPSVVNKYRICEHIDEDSKYDCTDWKWS